VVSALSAHHFLPVLLLHGESGRWWDGLEGVGGTGIRRLESPQSGSSLYSQSPPPLNRPQCHARPALT